MLLESVTFTIEEAAEFQGMDHLSFFIAPPHSARPIAVADAVTPLESELVLTGSSDVLLILNAESASTRFSLSFKCVPAGRRIGSMYLPVILYYMVLSAFAFLSLLFFLMLMYWLCYCHARRNQQ